MKKSILISIADGFHYRYLVDTGIIKGLAKSFKIIIVCPNSLISDLKNNAKENNFDCELFSFEVKYDFFSSFLVKFYKKVIHESNQKLTQTLNIKNEITPSKIPFIFNFIIKKIKHFTFFYDFILFILRKGFSNIEIEKLYLDYKFIFFISSTPGQKDFDLPFLFYSSKYKVKSLSPVYSWDNLTAKGPFYFNPDFIIVWNHIMKDEAISFHDYSVNNVFVCGVPVFDVYSHVLNSKFEKENFLLSFGFKKNLPLITLTTIPQIYFGNSHLDLAKLLIKESGKAIPEFLLLIRPHPMDETDYSELVNFENVFVDYHGSKPDKSLKNWKPASNNLLHLGNTMRYSDVVINIASTITIDAAYFDTPIINVSFDIKQNDSDYFGSISRYYKYTHYKHVSDCNAVYIANNFNMLLEQVCFYLNDPSIHRLERKSLVEKQVVFLDGNSNGRVIDCVTSLIV